jgi:hypothetical protein
LPSSSWLDCETASVTVGKAFSLRKPWNPSVVHVQLRSTAGLVPFRGTSRGQPAASGDVANSEWVSNTTCNPSACFATNGSTIIAATGFCISGKRLREDSIST